ncbi:hypothetical protein OHS33_36560 [Streptomyces sp. NBC_00536]|uniref:hypothetical protein n=1 Tax=Streptomyces sp. NBC_00536 TaxID=2975769 RepID=UPI002E821ED5|nr:hypothetical protein [Streptomyces sp. NBC_00536]WUC83397.1 hypothetical protein OHS33_36560 [Streptomyces sp. NBC_00536]
MVCRAVATKRTRTALRTPLAELLATRIRSQSEFAETEVPYGKAYAVAAAGCSPAELTEIGATEPTPRPRTRRSKSIDKAAPAAARNSDTEIPVQTPVNA